MAAGVEPWPPFATTPPGSRRHRQPFNPRRVTFLVALEDFRAAMPPNGSRFRRSWPGRYGEQFFCDLRRKFFEIHRNLRPPGGQRCSVFEAISLRSRHPYRILFSPGNDAADRDQLDRTVSRCAEFYLRHEDERGSWKRGHQVSKGVSICRSTREPSRPFKGTFQECQKILQNVFYEREREKKKEFHKIRANKSSFSKTIPFDFNCRSPRRSISTRYFGRKAYRPDERTFETLSVCESSLPRGKKRGDRGQETVSHRPMISRSRNGDAASRRREEGYRFNEPRRANQESKRMRDWRERVRGGGRKKKKEKRERERLGWFEQRVADLLRRSRRD
ncbi:uncharacterized protein LOC143362109 isoform X2 [Halictus rubicundus]|uniref:uncharacterized protein LOC143362109 isoform X2 n=1 Tax=Halictus rubicundus TaxID=77578 RepID=UPI0040350995